ncbi:MAG TPA: SAM-dependent methyltransferase [Solirubrobacteraceae bacterium]|nr:SAM-dependent methyltransferase [Solirubrobacteraceae bacterium]
MSTGRVRFVGCGPGAADLLTLRAVRAIAAADVVVWSPTLLAEAVVVEHARPDAELVAWPPATQRDIVAVYDRAAREGLQVVRLKGGDPTFFGELQDDLRELRALGVDVEVVPGVTAVSAGAAALCCEIATAAAPLVLAAAGAPADAGAGVVGVLNTGRDPAAVAAGLAARGLAPSTPCAVLVAVSRPGEIVVTCALDELAETLRDYGSPGLTTVLAGPAVAAARSGTRR